MTKDDEGGRGGQPKDDERWRRGEGGSAKRWRRMTEGGGGGPKKTKIRWHNMWTAPYDIQAFFGQGDKEPERKEECFDIIVCLFINEEELDISIYCD